MGLAYETGYTVDTATTVRTRLPAAELYEDAVLILKFPEVGLASSFRWPCARAPRFYPTDLAVELSVVWENWAVHDIIILDARGASITEIAALGSYELSAVEIERRLENTLCIRLGGEVGPEALGFGSHGKIGLRVRAFSVPDEYLSAMSVDLDKFIIASGVAYEFDKYVVELTYAAVLMPFERLLRGGATDQRATSVEWAVNHWQR